MIELVIMLNYFNISWSFERCALAYNNHRGYQYFLPFITKYYSYKFLFTRYYCQKTLPGLSLRTPMQIHFQYTYPLVYSPLFVSGRVTQDLSRCVRKNVNKKCGETAADFMTKSMVKTMQPTYTIFNCDLTQIGKSLSTRVM